MSGSKSVSSLTQQCFDRLHEAIAITKDKKYQALLESRLASFNLWADGVGALATGGLSLDSRFRSRPDNLDFVKTLLSLFSDFVKEFQEIANKGHPISEAIANIDVAIKSLAEIGVAIRRTGIASRSRRANQSFNPDEHHDFRRHLECLVLLRPNEDRYKAAKINKYIKSIPADSNEKNEKLRIKLEQQAKSRIEELDFSKLNDIQKRLIDANLRRRHNFLVAQKHSQRVKNMTKYTKPIGRQKQDTGLVEFAENIPTTHDSSNTKVPTPLAREDQPAKINAPLTATGYTTASTAEGTLHLGPAKKQQDERTIARSQISIIADNTEFPLAPLSKHQLVFKCPCCCQSLPGGDFKSPNKWRQHLIEDLCPYTCIAQSCPTPDMLFTTRKAWEFHIENDHPPQWQCVLCDEENEAFSLEEDITAHTLTQHKEELSKYELSFLISSAEVRYLGIKSCPLCSSYGPRDSPELVDHVVRHAYEFALRALPWPQPVMENLNKPIGTYSLPEDTFNAKRLENWLASLQESGKELAMSSFDKMNHEMQENGNDTPTNDYFANNDYFEDKELEGFSKCQIAQARSSMIWSDASGRDLDNQNSQDDTMQTGINLNAAAARGDEDAIRSLIEDGRIFKKGRRERKRALKLAIQGGHIAVVKQLLRIDVDINTRDTHGRTALFLAVEQSDMPMAQHLIESGIDVYTKDHDGLTALHMAIQNGSREIISALLTPNTHREFTDEQVQEAISWAQEQGHLSAAQVARYESILSHAQATFSIEDRTAAAQSIIQGDDWYALIDPLLEPASFCLVKTLPHRSRVSSVVFNHNGTQFATGSYQGDMRIFDTMTKACLCHLDLNIDARVYPVCFTPDGQSLITAAQAYAKVWDITTKTAQYSFVHKESIHALDVSKDGRLLASGDGCGTTKLWNMERGVKKRN
ncbi:hypothetical protein TrVFT333_007000 [Trichoderma virens FT-333]|nr:hypothetical protein TrVFT333_007000 [Trichoderma virens FT-333]